MHLALRAWHCFPAAYMGLHIDTKLLEDGLDHTCLPVKRHVLESGQYVLDFATLIVNLKWLLSNINHLQHFPWVICVGRPRAPPPGGPLFFEPARARGAAPPPAPP